MTRTMRWMLRLAAVVVCAMVVTPARAAFHLFQIAEFFSNADGSVQFVRLHEAFGSNFQDLFAGQTLTCSDGVTTHTFTFPGNLPSSSTANKDVLIATAGFGELPGGVTPDFIIPSGFLFTSGGSLAFSFVQTVNYGAMPVDGQHSVLPSGATQVNTPRNFAGASGSVNVGGGNPTGSCCVNNACTSTTQANCTGTWTSGGACNPDPCAPPPGVCCAGVTCRVTAAANCTGPNTLFSAGSACNAQGNSATPCCRADFNHVNGINVQDIFDFLNKWFESSPTTDFLGNGAGAPTVNSIFSFLNAWFTGC